ncbi:hypothetical protein [Synechococcus sp. M16CYN]|uniref:hypothetical protein n=1 Tax=Synechococcus sp. M16CYN TaxID=3103139 RepID=UPI003341AC9B
MREWSLHWLVPEQSAAVDAAHFTNRKSSPGSPQVEYSHLKFPLIDDQPDSHPACRFESGDFPFNPNRLADSAIRIRWDVSCSAVGSRFVSAPSP